MTSPQERMRAIVWGAEVLQELQSDETIPTALRSEAQRVAAAFPSDQNLQALIEAGRCEFPPELGQAVEDARILFEQIQLDCLGSPETRKALRYTLRHFPLKGWSRHAANAARLGQLGDWLEVIPMRPAPTDPGL